MIQILRNLLQKTNSKPPLGRWTIEKCNTKLDQKIDLANEDHCGPCGNYDRPVNVIKANESVDSIKSSKYTKVNQLNIQKFLGTNDMLTIDHLNQLNYLPVYLPAYKLPTYPPTYPTTYSPTYSHIAPRKNIKVRYLPHRIIN